MPSAASTSVEPQRRSSRQRIDLSKTEEGIDRRELERALRASLDDANKKGIKLGDPSNNKKKTKKMAPPQATKKAVPVNKKTPISKVKPNQRTPLKTKAETKAETKPMKEIVEKNNKKTVAKPVVEVPKVQEKTKELPAVKNVVKKEVTKKKGKPQANTKNRRLNVNRTSEFITLLACAKKVLGDH